VKKQGAKTHHTRGATSGTCGAGKRRPAQNVRYRAAPKQQQHCRMAQSARQQQCRSMQTCSAGTSSSDSAMNSDSANVNVDVFVDVEAPSSLGGSASSEIEVSGSSVADEASAMTSASVAAEGTPDS